MPKRIPTAAKRIAILLAMLLTVDLAASLAAGVYASLSSRKGLVVVNYSPRPVRVRILLDSGAEIAVTCAGSVCEVAPHGHIKRVIVRYGSFNYEVEVRHHYRVYAVAFPYGFKPFQSRVVAYSVFEEKWEGAPWGLEIMVGTESCYVEESLAGRIFELFWSYPAGEVGDLLDEMGIADRNARFEIAATALWAAQLVREVKEGRFDAAAGARAVDHILPPPLSVLAKPILLAVAYAVGWLDKDFLYALILSTIKGVHGYVAVFPEWKKVDEKRWAAMCRRLEGYTLEPRIPTYVHVLLAGALLLYLAKTFAPVLPAALLAALATRRLLARRRLQHPVCNPHLGR